ncbi:MAG: putative toxin-antitoxin system toxin component, PIN family [Nitrososphaera sp.]
MRIVLDTNVLISALIKKGRPRELLLALVVKSSDHDIILRDILEEFTRVAADPKIQAYVSRGDVERFLRDIVAVAKIVRARSKIKAVKEDPADDIILGTCYDGKASHLVSGDSHLLKLGRFRRTRIVSVDEMLAILKEE